MTRIGLLLAVTRFLREFLTLVHDTPLTAEEYRQLAEVFDLIADLRLAETAFLDAIYAAPSETTLTVLEASQS